MPRPSAVAVLTIAGYVLLVVCAALIAHAVGGLLVAAGIGAGAAGAACLLLSWQLDR